MRRTSNNNVAAPMAESPSIRRRSTGFPTMTTPPGLAATASGLQLHARSLEAYLKLCRRHPDNQRFVEGAAEESARRSGRRSTLMQSANCDTHESRE